MNLFDLAAVLTLDKSGYTKGLNDAESEASGFSSKLKSGLGTAAKVGAASLAVIGSAAVGATKSLLGTSSQAAELGDHIDKQSQKIGISAKAYQEWDFILTHNGASVDSLQASMKTLSTQAEKNAEEFQALGISEEQLQKMTPEELFENVVKGLQNMEEGTERTAIAAKLLGRSATELAPVFNSTSEDIEEMRQQAHALGKVMSDEAVKSGAAYEDSLYNLQTAMGGLKNQMAANLLPSIVSVMDGITGLFSGDNSAVDKVSEGIGKLVEKIGEAIPNIMDTMGKVLPTVVEAVSKNIGPLVKGATQLVIKFVKQLPKIIKPIIKALPGIIKDIAKAIAENAPELIKGVIELITDLVKELPAILLAVAQALPDILSGIFHGLIDNLPELIAGVVELVEGLVANLPQILASIVTAVGGLVGDMISAIFPFGDEFKKMFEGFDFGGFIGGVFEEALGIAKGIFKFFGELMDDPGQALKNAFDGIKDYAVKVFESVKTIITNIFDAIKEAKAKAEAEKQLEKVRSGEEKLILEGKAQIVQGIKYSDEFYDALEAKKAIYGENFGTVDYLTHNGDNAYRQLEVKGEIIYKGVNDKGELVAALEESHDYIVDEMERETRLGG